jgi:SAM-dependent methyltransferase
MIKEALWMLRHLKYYLSPRRSISSWCKDLAAWQRFWKSYQGYKQLASPSEQPRLDHLYPCLGDDTAQTPIDPIYFYQDAWAFEKIVNQNPRQHIDVGSHHKFVALLSKVVPVTMVDIRPLSLPLDTLSFQEGSILELPFEDRSIESLSSLCVVEHIGLGRYGDLLDPKGTEKAIRELKRVVKANGNLYLSLPINDKNYTFFNAHRILSEDYFLNIIQPFKIIEKSYIFGGKFTNQKLNGFGIGLYFLQNKI